MKGFPIICCITILFLQHAQTLEGASFVDRYVAIAIQGDLKPALPLLDSVDATSPATDRELADRFHLRFVEVSEPRSPASGNAVIDEIVSLYRDYWRIALLQYPGLPADGDAQETILLESLQTYIGKNFPEVAQDDPYAALQQVIEAQGFHALLGPAAPLEDLLIWRDESEEKFETELTDQTVSVRVVFLSDIYSQGWKHYATLGLASTTGWVQNEMLYCIDGTYATGTETFLVSYLKHEGRHLADLQILPNLPAVDLEYRAKLTELAFAGSTQRRLLDDFTAKSALNPDSPHAEANFRVTRDLWRELYGTPFPGGTGQWMTVSPGKVNRAAERLLFQDTAMRSRSQQRENPSHR